MHAEPGHVQRGLSCPAPGRALQYVMYRPVPKISGEGTARAEPGRHGGKAGQPAGHPDGGGGQRGGGDQDQDGDGG